MKRGAVSCAAPDSLHAVTRYHPCEVLITSCLDPVHRLHACNQHRLARSVRLKNRRFAFFYLEPVFAERVEDVGLVRHDERVFACGRHNAGQFPESFRPAIVFDGRHDETAFGDIQCRTHFTAAHQLASLDRPIEFAGVDVTELDAKLLEGGADLLRNINAAGAEHSLLRNVVMGERIGIRLIAIRRAVTKHNNITALLHRRGQRFKVGGLRARTRRERGQENRAEQLIRSFIWFLLTEVAT